MVWLELGYAFAPRGLWPRVAALNAPRVAFGLKSIATELLTLTRANPDQYATLVNGD